MDFFLIFAFPVARRPSPKGWAATAGRHLGFGFFAEGVPAALRAFSGSFKNGFQPYFYRCYYSGWCRFHGRSSDCRARFVGRDWLAYLQALCQGLIFLGLAGAFSASAMEEGVYRSNSKTDRPLPSWVRAPEYGHRPPPKFTVIESSKGYRPPPRTFRIELVEAKNDEKLDIPDPR